MRRCLALPVLSAAVLALLAGAAFAQSPKTPDVLGTWIGNAVVGDDGTQIEITVIIGKTDLGYTGKISDTAGMVPETDLRQIVFKDNKLTFELDLAQTSGTTLIKIELLLDQETLKGVWFDPDGNSGAIELLKKK
jgi:hypothetical protein